MADDTPHIIVGGWGSIRSVPVHLPSYSAGKKAVREQVTDWARRHAEHAGHAPLAELNLILNGEHYGDA